MWLLNGYGVISVALFPSAALESEVAFRLPFFLSKYR